MPSAHYFFALALPSEVKRDLHALSESIQKEFPFKKWVHPEDYHITLAFLGHAPEPMLNEAIYRTGLALADTSSFSPYNQWNGNIWQPPISADIMGGYESV